jgi:hypothetical protein
VDERSLRGPMQFALWHFADRSYRWLKILNARSRMLLGEKPHAATTKYDGAPIVTTPNASAGE